MSWQEEFLLDHLVEVKPGENGQNPIYEMKDPIPGHVGRQLLSLLKVINQKEPPVDHIPGSRGPKPSSGGPQPGSDSPQPGPTGPPPGTAIQGIGTAIQGIGPASHETGAASLQPGAAKQ
ncbi:hypothetical protein PYW07_000130 [Mythimna separata]|uniref:Uncharacterized protein n=1 Tax=Mythimna separata TaxID=271217 RepID=A0AAD7Z391_MYTSE|nr:hypothetical protein PYW07_000130 [Mythimna separata]